MTSPAPSTANVHGSSSDPMDFEAGVIRPANSNGDYNRPYPVSTNPLGFSFTGQFCVQSRTSNQISEKKPSEISTQISIDATEVAISHVNEIDKIQDATYQKAIHEMREKYLPSYSNFLWINSALQTGRVASMNSRERKRSPSRDRANGAYRSKLENEMASDDK